MTIVGVQRIFLCQIKVIAVFHKELASAHHTKPWPHLVAEFPLDVIQRQRQVLVAAHMRAEDVRDHLFVRRTIKHVTVLTVADPQHFGTIGIVAPALAPKISRLQCGHQHRDVPGAHLFLVHDVFQLSQHFETQRQPRVDTGCVLLDHPSPQHQTVADNLCLSRVFAQHGHEVAGQTHRMSSCLDGLPLIRPIDPVSQSPNASQSAGFLPSHP